MEPSEALKSSASSVWNKLVEHKFVEQLANGTLEESSFRQFISQDCKFLMEYARALALCIANAPDVPTMTYFSGLLNTTLIDEMAMCKSFAQRLGLETSERIENELVGPMRGYAEFLVHTASRGPFGDSIAALLPCVWVYVDVGKKLSDRENLINGKYSQWVEAYAAPELISTSDHFRRLVDVHLANLSAEEWISARNAFVTSCDFELAVWDAAVATATARGQGACKDR